MAARRIVDISRAPAQVFISYAARDRARVLPIADSLLAAGVSICLALAHGSLVDSEP